MYQISANLVHRELRNATFEGEKMPTSITLPDSGHRSHAHPPMKWCHVLSTRRVEREPSWATVKFAGMKLKFLALWERTDGLTELSDADVSRKHAPLIDIFALAFWWVFYYCCHSLCGTYCAMTKISAKTNTADCGRESEKLLKIHLYPMKCDRVCWSATPKHDINNNIDPESPYQPKPQLASPSLLLCRVRKCNWGWHFFIFKSCVSQLGSDRMLFRQNNRPNNYAEYSAEQYLANILIVRS